MNVVMACLKNGRPAEWSYSVFKETVFKKMLKNNQSKTLHV